ncbi:short-chain dehydrogenase [Planctomycetales bacterium]|nr:short-chain dehydrogenase [Planctomycetales bacterium]
MMYSLVTGATRGIGKAAAKMLLERGDFVFINYANSDETAENVQKEFAPFADRFDIVKADLSNLNGVDILFQAVHQRTKTLDNLVLNAAVTHRCSFEDITPEIWNRIFDTDLTIPFFTVQKFSPILSEGASIVFLGSLIGIHPHAVSLPYGVAKAGVVMLAQSLVKVFRTRNITVNTVVPGFTDTEWQKTKSPELRQRIESKIALRRFGLPEEVAKAIVAVLENKYMNGATVVVDGGYCME